MTITPALNFPKMPAPMSLHPSTLLSLIASSCGIADGRKHAAASLRCFPHLPPELWSLVFSHIHTKRRLREVRLVCFAFSELAARDLFETLSFNLTPLSLQRLSKVASHPSLRACVRHLEFRPLVLPFFACRYRWARTFVPANKFQPEISHIRPLRYCQFGQYQREQAIPAVLADDIEASASFSTPASASKHELVEAMVNLINLQGIEVRVEPFRIHQYVWITWRNLRACVPFTYAMAAEVNKQVACLLYALGTCNSYAAKITYLGLKNWNWSCWSSESLRTLWSSRRLLQHLNPPSNGPYRSLFSVMQNAFSRITALDLDLSFCCTSEAAQVANCAASLKKMTNLCTLKLMVNRGLRPLLFVGPHDVNGEDFAITFAAHAPHVSREEHTWNILAYLQRVEWPKLRKLEISLASSEKYLVGLLSRVGPTLEELYLVDCCLFGSWHNVILRLRDVCSLKSVHMHRLLGYDDDITSPWDEVEGEMADFALFPDVLDYRDLGHLTKDFGVADLEGLRATMGMSGPEFTVFIQRLTDALRDQIYSFVLGSRDEASQWDAETLSLELFKLLSDPDFIERYIG